MDQPEDDAAPDLQSAPAVAATYQVRPEGERYRNEVRRVSLEERAQRFRDLVALSALEHQAEAMTLILGIERATVREMDALDNSWSAEVQSAYSTGRAEQANESLEALTGEEATNPTTAAKESPDLVH